MKKLAATATANTAATPQQAYALLIDLDAYPSWYPAGVPSAETIERNADGVPTVAKARIEVNVGPIKRGFNVHLAVTATPDESVELKRMPKSADDHEELNVCWRIVPAPGGGSTLSAELTANLSVSPFLPVEPFAPMIAQGFADAAAAALA
jgi:ribosome-associated toxin RatA of RatAB toxin-antitoxin module